MLELAFFANGTLALAYLAISAIILRGLHASGQLRSNRLGLATATIFFTCGIGHGFHGIGVLEALQPGHASAAHDATMYSWPLVLWDTLTATVGLTYLSLRKSYGVLLRPAMFEDLERNRSEARVREAEELFRTSFDHAPIGKALVSADGRFLRVNRALAEIVGVSREELLDTTFQEITHPEDLDADLEQLTQMLAGDIDQYDMEKRYLRPDGTHVWVKLDVAAMRTPDGDFAHAIAQIQDITARRASERALAHYAELVGSSDDAIVGLDPAGRVISWNAGAQRLLGTSPAEAIGQLVGAASPPSDPAADEALLARVRAGTTVNHHESRRRRPDGSEVDLLLTVSPVRDERSDEVVGIAVVGHDITERVQAEQAVRDAEELFRTAFAQAPIGMALVGLDGAVRTVNEALCRSLGYEEDQLLRRNLEDLTHVDDADADRDGLRRVLDGKAESTSSERRLLHAAGHPVWVLMQTNLVRTPSGRPRHYLVQAIDITARRRFEEQLQHMADHDPLTGLLNRRSFERELERQAATAARYGTRGALLVLDLDEFKFVNDTLGHNAGDELIVATAQVLRERMRDTDQLARLGGDEFAVILPEATREEAGEVATSLLDCIRTAKTLRRPSGAGVSASMGVALFEPELTAQDVLVNADLAMYDAKEDGRDRVAFFEGEGYEQPRIKSRMTWIERIERAIAEESFILHAQPILDLHVGDVAMFELLVRLPGENGDVIPPATFLYIAERHDLVQAIDRWVARTAIDLIAAHRDAGRHLALSVNVSGRSLGDQALLEEIERGLRATGIPPQRLILEITETAAVGNVHLARRFGERVHELGCRLAIDDFGAGFGSFYYLKHLPFDFLKIDGEFVQQCLDNRTDQLVVQAVVAIARGLGRETIAEFVGDERTQRFLRREGVDYSQGFHVGRPLPLDEALEGVGLPTGDRGRQAAGSVLPVMRRTKIVATIGPASRDPEILVRMVDAGLDVARLNFSHGSHDQHRETAQLVRDAASRAGRPVAILQDLPGPKLRIGPLADDRVVLNPGDTVTFTCGDDDPPAGTASRMSITWDGLADAMSPGDVLYLADGTVRLRTVASRPGEVDAEVEIGGSVASRQGLNIPGPVDQLPAVPAEDLEHLKAGMAIGVDMVALSFVRRPEDVTSVREHTRVPLIAKIEKPQAVARAEEILRAADCVMVARGDLGIELPIEEVPMVQKRLLRLAGALARPSITATQMLDSMVQSSRPTRAEVTDVANAILDGTDAVMLSQETAVGQYPIGAIAMLDAIARQTEKEAPYAEWNEKRVSRDARDPSYTVAHSACEAARDLELDALVIPTLSGRSVRLVSAHRPNVPIYALSPGKETVRRCGLMWGVQAESMRRHEVTEELIADAARRVVELGWLSPGQRVGITAGLPSGRPGSTSLFKVQVLPHPGEVWPS